MQPTTILSDWYIIDFERDGAPEEVQVAWGIVKEDPSGRWSPGNYSCTSPIQREVTEEGVLYAITGNSIYQLDGPGKRITMPTKTILALRGGYAPPEIMASQSMQKD
ncbi:hypothetical protein DXI23_20260 [Marinobacter flavimaris]|uniref:Uncharacterized protein n=1 Tax=Marinobacter flavimaris TaxID=262076 RepID=A0A3D8GXA0_9GAMM|nr:hypothetical protein [Marinobacter flavimaris]PPI78448.1 hypothetical protein MDHKLMBL_20075 [Marinobacter flavimaris]RDU39063.1 hypothetical protein DXI23_20260 [Marinobacter flavimaris]